jgi:hypothetical protein
MENRMSNVNLNINFNPKAVVAILSVIGIIALAYKMPVTKAQSSFVLTGKYGCVDNPNSLPYVTAFTGRPEDTYLNSVYIVDFDARTANGYQVTMTGFNGANPLRGVETGTIRLTVTILGDYMIKITNSGGFNANLAIVNSGNTLLGIDVKTGNSGQPSNVICQKV